MTLRSFLFALVFNLSLLSAFSQKPEHIDPVAFFTDDAPLEATLGVDLKVLLREKPQDGNYVPATFAIRLPDSSTVKEDIRLTTRGHSRREICYVPPIRLNFQNPGSPFFSSLKMLKLVSGCKVNPDAEQLLFKEYLIYKMYNLFTDLGYRVRLLHLTYEDTQGKKKSIVQYAFFTENIDALAKRTHCKEYRGDKLFTEQTDRKQMTLVAMFEYMIGNTDWGVPAAHNIKLVRSKKDSLIRPYPIPYDFDYSGLVDAEYAVPDSKLPIEKVTERLYRGFPRTPEEIQEMVDLFNSKKEAVYQLIQNFNLLNNRTKKEMTGYLDDFYSTINDKRMVKSVFIDGARKE